MKMLRIRISLILMCACLGSQAQIGPDVLARLDLLPQIKTQVYTGMFSSYDRTGGNDDGFSGKYSYLRKEGDGLVIAEMDGPGVIYRIHMPGPQEGIVEFYFDGESTPRIRMKVAEMVDGSHAPFLAPLVGSGVGGRYSYVPIPYRKSCKIVIKAPNFCFYDINYATYPVDTEINSFQMNPTEEWISSILRITKLIDESGQNISRYMVADGQEIKTLKIKELIQPGKSYKLFHLREPGRIAGLRLGPASAFAGKERQLVLNIYWDNDPLPAISCPVGDLFGYSFGQPATQSLFSGTSGGVNYLYLPMPFEKNARLELVNESPTGESFQLEAELDLGSEGKQTNEGHLYGYWHRENPCTPGKPFTYLTTEGKGHVVGVFLQAQGIQPGGTIFFEGDDVVTIDGKMTIHGTGSEDSFNGGWYDVPGRWEARASFPLSGCLDYKKYLGRTGGYRWMIGDAYSFNHSIDYTIEHGPEGNTEITDYVSVTFFYSTIRPSADLSLPKMEERAITSPDKIVFVPGWNVPIHSSPLKNGIIEKKSEQVGSNRVRFFSLKTNGPDEFGPHHVSFIFDIPVAGKYQVSLKSVKGPDQGIIQLFRYDSPLGDPIDLFSAEAQLSPIEKLAVIDLFEGDNVLYFKLIGQNPQSTGLNMKLVEILFEKID